MDEYIACEIVCLLFSYEVVEKIDPGIFIFF